MEPPGDEFEPSPVLRGVLVLEESDDKGEDDDAGDDDDSEAEEREERGDGLPVPPPAPPVWDFFVLLPSPLLLVSPLMLFMVLMALRFPSVVLLVLLVFAGVVGKPGGDASFCGNLSVLFARLVTSRQWKGRKGDTFSMGGGRENSTMHDEEAQLGRWAMIHGEKQREERQENVTDTKRASNQSVYSV